MTKVNHVAAVCVVWAIVAVLLIICVILLIYLLLCAKRRRQTSSHYNHKEVLYMDGDENRHYSSSSYREFEKLHERDLVAEPPSGVYSSPLIVDVRFANFQFNSGDYGGPLILVSIDYSPANNSGGGAAALNSGLLNGLNYYYDDHQFLAHRQRLYFDMNGTYTVYCHSVYPAEKKVGAIHVFQYCIVNGNLYSNTNNNMTLGLNNNNNRDIDLYLNRQFAGTNNALVTSSGGNANHNSMALVLVPPTIQPNSGTVTTATPISITHINGFNHGDNFEVLYSTDGGYPNTLYTSPFYLPNSSNDTQGKMIKAMCVNNTQRTRSAVAEALLMVSPSNSGSNNNNGNQVAVLSNTISNQAGGGASSNSALVRLLRSFVNPALPGPTARVKTRGALLYMDESNNPKNTHTVFQIVSLADARREAAGGGSPKVKFSRRRGTVYRGTPIPVTDDVALVYAWTVADENFSAGGANNNTNTAHEGRLRSVATIYDCTKFATEHTRPKSKDSDEGNAGSGCTTLLPAPVICISCEEVELVFDDLAHISDRTIHDAVYKHLKSERAKGGARRKEESIDMETIQQQVSVGQPFIAYTLNNKEPLLNTSDRSAPACAALLAKARDSSNGSDDASDVYSAASGDDNRNHQLVVSKADTDGSSTIIYTPGKKIFLTELSRLNVNLTARVFVPLYISAAAAAAGGGNLLTYTTNNTSANKETSVILSSYVDGKNGPVTTVNKLNNNNNTNAGAAGISTVSSGGSVAYCISDVFHRGFFFDPHH